MYEILAKQLEEKIKHEKQDYEQYNKFREESENKIHLDYISALEDRLSSIIWRLSPSTINTEMSIVLGFKDISKIENQLLALVRDFNEKASKLEGFMSANAEIREDHELSLFRIRRAGIKKIISSSQGGKSKAEKGFDYAKNVISPFFEKFQNARDGKEYLIIHDARGKPIPIEKWTRETFVRFCERASGGRGIGFGKEMIRKVYDELLRATSKP